MSPELYGVILGAAISSAVPILTTIVNAVSARSQRKADEKIKYREALFRLAFDYWQAESPQRKPLVVPLEEYLIRMDSMYALFVEDSPTPLKVNTKLEAFGILKEQWKKYETPTKN